MASTEEAFTSGAAFEPGLDKRDKDVLKTYTVAAHLDDPVRVGEIRVQGVARARPRFVEYVVSPLLNATTLGDLVTRLRQTTYRLERLDVFDHIDVDLHSPPAGEGRPVDVLIAVREAPFTKVTSKVVLGENEAGAYASVAFPSLFGAAERVEARAYAGSRSTELLARLSIPFRGNPDQTFGVSAYRRVNVRSSEYEEHVRGATFDYKFLSRLGLHELAYHADWRRIHPEDIWSRLAGWPYGTGNAASEAVRAQAGYDFKSSVSHTFIRDTRDDRLIPSQGSYLKLSQEYADIGGDVKFIKGQADVQVTVSPAARLALTSTVRGGLLVPLRQQHSRINDRFFLGGATNVRGFRNCGIGPREADDALGGELFVAVGLRATTRLNDSSVGLPRYTHAWINAGKLVNLDKGDAAVTNALQLVETPAVAAGVGLVCKFRNLRAEANLGFPLSFATADVPKFGLQVGFGSDLL